MMETSNKTNMNKNLGVTYVRLITVKNEENQLMIKKGGTTKYIVPLSLTFFYQKGGK